MNNQSRCSKIWVHRLRHSGSSTSMLASKSGCLNLSAPGGNHPGGIFHFVVLCFLYLVNAFRNKPWDLREKGELNQFDPAKTLLLFSSEPFPFAKKKSELVNLGFSSALVDGESFSWFGVRSLNFIETQLVKK